MLRRRRDPTFPPALVTGLLVALLSADGRADDSQAGESSPEGGRVVMLADRDDEEMNADVFQAVIGQLSDLPVELEVEWLDVLPDSLDGQIAAADRAAGSGETTLAVFWIALESEEEILLHVSDARRRRILVRRLDRSEAGAQFEALALIVHASIDALLKGGVIGIEAPPPAESVPSAVEEAPAEPSPAPGPTPAVKPAPIERPWLGLEAGYDMAIHSDQHPMMHGVSLALSANPLAGVIVRVGYVLRTPVVVEDDLVTILVEHHPVSVGLGYRFALDRFVLGGSVILTADYTVQTTNRLTSPTGVANDNSDLLFSVTPNLDLGVVLNERVVARISVGPEIITNNIRYIYATNAAREVILEPWWVQPRIFAGVGVWMF